MIKLLTSKTRRFECTLRVLPHVTLDDVAQLKANPRISRIVNRHIGTEPQHVGGWRKNYGFHEYESIGKNLAWVEDWGFLLAFCLLETIGDENLASLHYAAIIGRECVLGSTGIGQGVAAPHLGTPYVDRSHVCAIRLEPGLAFDFRAVDGHPVELTCLLLVNDKNAGERLRLLETISRLYKDEEIGLNSIDDRRFMEILENAL